VTIYRWVQRFTPLLMEATRSCRHTPGDRWFVDETYVNLAGRWVYLYRAIDQYGQVIDVVVSEKRDPAATREFFTRALEHGPPPTEVTTDQAPAYPRVIEELIPAACHVTEQYATDEIVNPATLCEVGVCLEPFLSPGGSGLRRRSGAGVKVERPAGRTTLTPARTGVASGGGRRGWTSSRRAG
jgi:hypothetical protein